jgi:hypothetical protein
MFGSASSAGDPDRHPAVGSDRRVEAGAPVELQEIVSAADELPLRVASGSASSHEASDAPDVFDLTEDWLDELLSTTVEGMTGSP